MVVYAAALRFVQWYLEELGVSYELIVLDLQNNEQRQPEYLAINPMGKVPALVDGEFKLWESGAILLYIAEIYGNLSDSPTERARSNQWILFANATLGPGLFVEASRERELPRLMQPLNQILQTHAFLMGAEFTVADVAVGSMLSYSTIILKLDLSAYPAVVDYIKRLAERPAFQKTIGNR